jgi:hypothetical protein
VGAFKFTDTKSFKGSDILISFVTADGKGGTVGSWDCIFGYIETYWSNVENKFVYVNKWFVLFVDVNVWIDITFVRNCNFAKFVM